MAVSSQLKGRYYNAVAGFIVSGIAFIYLYGVFDKEVFYASLVEFRGVYLLLSAVCIALTVHVRSVRWRCLLAMDDSSISAKFYWGGHFFNLVLPAKLGEVIRVALATKYLCKPIGYVLARSFLDRVFDLLVLLMLFFFAVLAMRILDLYHGVVVLVLLSVLSIALLFLFKYPLVFSSSFSLVRTFIKVLSDAKVAILDVSKKQFYFAVWLSALAFMFDVLLSFFLITSLGLELPVLSPFVITLFLYLGALLPSAPAQFGVHQAAAVAAMSFYSVDPGVAITYSLVQLSITVLVVSLVASCLWIFVRVS